MIKAIFLFVKFFIIYFVPIVSFLYNVYTFINKKLFKQPKGEKNMEFSSKLVETKAQLVEALKESEEWKILILHLEKIIIDEIKAHTGSPWYTVLLEIVGAALGQLPQEMIDAVKGSAGIPAEWKAAGWTVWSAFLVEFLVEEGNIIISIFTKSA